MRMSLKSLNGLKGQTIQTPVVEVVKKSKPVKWSVTKVQKVMRLSEAGNKRVTMYKVTNTAGLKKYFVSHKAARLFVKTNR
jgi:GR25 family glycosyltransferase involved in LPS biosynthesis